MDVANLCYEKLREALKETAHDFLERKLPLRRITLLASILKKCDVELSTPDALINRLLQEQHEDGGWVDCEDTAWTLYYLSLHKRKENVKKGLLWLSQERCRDGGWGFCRRDRANIPITSQIMFLFPHFLPSIEAWNWLNKEWGKDLSQSVNLNYKAAWYLLASRSLAENKFPPSELQLKTIDYLIHEQRNDGSWGPWKSHPAPSECFITGICLAALSLAATMVGSNGKKEVISSMKKSLKWINNNQLENGLFPTHYIEEGSAWIFLGLSKSLSILDE